MRQPNGKHTRGRRNGGHHHFDNAGHLSPEHAERLLSLTMSARGAYLERPFIDGTQAEDTFAEELGEGTVLAMTSGEDRVAEDLNGDVEEDWGGPFVVTNANKEFAGGTDASNIEEATREPFPKT
jgi:hypothetical protein